MREEIGSKGDSSHRALRSNRKIGARSVFGVIGWNLLFWGVAAYGLHAAFAAPSPTFPSLLGAAGLALPAVGIGLAWRRVGRFLVQAWKFGDTTLVLDHSPVRLGGTLAGRVRAETQGHREPAVGFLVRLSCYERVERWRRGGRAAGHKEVRYHLVWRDEKRLRSASRPDPSSVEIPVALRLPEDAPATDEGPEEGLLARIFRARKVQVAWRLEVLAPMPGVDFSEAIEVPVREAVGEPAPAVVEERVREAAAREVELRRPRSEGIHASRTPSGGLEITFDSSRHRKRSLAASGIGLLLGAGTYWVWAAGLPWWTVLIGVLLTLLMLWGAWDYWTLSARVTVGPRGVTVERRRSIAIPLEEVEDVRADLERGAIRIGRSLPADAIPATYELKVLRAEGSEVRLAQHLDDKPEADWLAGLVMDGVRRHAEPATSRTGGLTG